MALRLDLRGNWRNAQSNPDVATGYTEVKDQHIIDIRPRMPLIGVLVMLGAFLTWMGWQALPHELIEIAAPFFGVTLVVALIIACESRRCPHCNTTYRRVDDADHPHHHLTVCPTCRTFFRDMASD